MTATVPAGLAAAAALLLLLAPPPSSRLRAAAGASRAPAAPGDGQPAEGGSGLLDPTGVGRSSSAVARSAGDQPPVGRTRGVACLPGLLQHARNVLGAAIARLGWGPAGRRAAARRRAAAIEFAATLVAELRAGASTRVAVMRAAAVTRPAVCPTAAGAARLDGDVATALRRDAEYGRVPLLRSVAACWEVGESSGAGLADAVERLVDTARAAEEVRVELEGQLAAPRATARLLATLPLLGLGMGVMLGADPVGWLTGGGIGRACLAGGAALTLLGLAWTGRIAARVERLL